VTSLLRQFRAWRKEERRTPLEPRAALRTVGICLAVILPLVSLQVLRRSQHSLHQERANRSDTLAIMESALAITDRAARDWGHWDDAYRFALGRNPTFEQTSLDGAGLFEGGVVMVMLNRSGELLLTHAAPGFQRPDYRDLIRCARDNQGRLPRVTSTVRLACVSADGALYLGAATPISDHTAAAPSAGALAIFDPMLKQEHSPLIREHRRTAARDPGAGPSAAPGSGGSAPA
jgi:sensor domain CHASE-containing protein